MIEFFCDGKHCPICKEILSARYSYRVCSNGCFKYTGTFNFHGKFVVYIEIFETEFKYDEEDLLDRDECAKNEIVRTVNYWKENDRYLAMILGG